MVVLRAESAFGYASVIQYFIVNFNSVFKYDLHYSCIVKLITLVGRLEKVFHVVSKPICSPVSDNLEFVSILSEISLLFGEESF